MSAGFSDSFKSEFERLFPGNDALMLLVRQGDAKEIKMHLEANTTGFDHELIALALDRGENGIATLRKQNSMVSGREGPDT